MHIEAELNVSRRCFSTPCPFCLALQPKRSPPTGESKLSGSSLSQAPHVVRQSFGHPPRLGRGRRTQRSVGAGRTAVRDPSSRRTAAALQLLQLPGSFHSCHSLDLISFWVNVFRKRSKQHPSCFGGLAALKCSLPLSRASSGSWRRLQRSSRRLVFGKPLQYPRYPSVWSSSDALALPALEGLDNRVMDEVTKSDPI